MAPSKEKEMVGEISNKFLHSRAKLILKRKEIMGRAINQGYCLPLNANLSTWSSPKRFRYVPRSSPVDDYLRRCSLNKANDSTSSTTLCRKCENVLSQSNTSLCNDCMIQGEVVHGMPKSLGVLYCQCCESYSFTGRVNFVRATLGSTTMLEFLLRKIELHLYGRRLNLIDASFMTEEPTSTTIELALLLEEQTGVIKRHIIEYIVAHQTCCRCMPVSPAPQRTYILQFRKCASDKRSIIHLILKIGRPGCDGIYKRCKRTENGLDICFQTESDLAAYSVLLCSRLLIRPYVPQKTANNGLNISAVLCPISEDDLVYVRFNKFPATLGSSGPLMICTQMDNSITLLNPSELTVTTVSNDEYWCDTSAFEVYKSSRDLVEYVVLEANITSFSTQSQYALANVKVARISDFGKNDIVFMARTHLGYGLKNGDRVFGYDLVGGNDGDNMVGTDSRGLLPEVILIKNKYTTLRRRVRKKIATSPEYSAFLRDLDKNPEALFNLSLDSENKTENQQSDTNSVKEGINSDFDLEGLLADLALGDQQTM